VSPRTAVFFLFHIVECSLLRGAFTQGLALLQGSCILRLLSTPVNHGPVGVSSRASRLNRATDFSPIPLTLSKSSHILKGLLPPLASHILAAITGPTPGRRASDSGGAVEKNNSGREINAGGSSCDAGVTITPEISDTTGTSCRSPSRHRIVVRTVLSTSPGRASNRNNIHAPAIRRIPSSHPAPGAGRRQSKIFQEIPYTKVRGVIR